MKNIPKFRAEKPLHLKKKDKQWKKCTAQIKIRGFSDSELWNLNYTIAAFILPRLKAFKNDPVTLEAYPSDCKNMKQWLDTLDKMIWAFEYALDEAFWGDTDSKGLKKYQEGLSLFAKHFYSLWN